MRPFRFVSSSSGEEFSASAIGDAATHRVVLATLVLMVVLTSSIIPGAARAQATEFCFGSAELREGRTLAVLGETWTFDHGGPDAFEGWTGTKPWGPVDREVIGWAHLDDFADDGLPPGMPIIDGEGMLWCGVHEATADSLCYICGMGYGEGWSQQMVSPPLHYSSGAVTLSFEYWRALGVGLVWSLGYAGCIVRRESASFGGSPDAPIEYEFTIPASEFADCPADSFLLSVAVAGSSPGDSDCTYDTQYGAFGVDNVVLSGGVSSTFDF
ncbi:MAG: hypothetical protein R3E97_13000 [Candidatus Eisenbacteria bacterium]